MTSWRKRSTYAAFLLGLAVCLVAVNSWGASDFIRVPLGKGASIEIPKNWTVISDNQRVTIDALVEAQGYRKSGWEFNFGANLYDEQGKTMALVNARFYPNNAITQAEARGATPSDLREFDIELKKNLEAPLNAMGSRMAKWFGSKMRVINGLYVLVHEHQQSGVGDQGTARVRGLRVWNSPRSFTVTLRYQVQYATMLLPIIDYMTNSLRQE
jgi:hypothetical protein